MSKRTFVAVMGVALAVVLATGGLIASNMGFKLNYALRGNGASGYKTSENTLALPFFTQVGMVNAGDLLADIEAGNTSLVTNVQRWEPTGPFRQTYVGGKTFGTNFALNAGEGTYVTMIAAGSKDYIVVGSHNPTTMITLRGNGSGGYKTNENLYAQPYHTTANNAGDLLNEIEAGNTSLITNVQRWEPTGPFRQTYVGGKTFGTNFAIKPGEFTFVTMATGSSTTFTPAHY
jgi:hypothetical protein